MFKRSQKDLIPISNTTRDYTQNPTVNSSKLDNQANQLANCLLSQLPVQNIYLDYPDDSSSALQKTLQNQYQQNGRIHFQNEGGARPYPVECGNS